MNATTLNPVPRWPAVLREQVRTVAGGVRRELGTAAALLLLLSLSMLIAHVRTPGHASDLQFAEMALTAVLLALFAPMAVWKGETPSRRAYLWALPVDAARHSLAKVLGGWAWLMVAVGGFMLWAATLARITGGALSLGDTRVMLRKVPEGVAPAAGDFMMHAWPVAPWQWLVPFTAATAVYLLASAVVLASDHPWRWFAGITFAFALLGVGGVAWAQRLQGALVMGRHGLEVLVTGANSRPVPVAAPGGGQVEAFAFVPAPGAWAVATLLWTGLGIAALLFAAHRRRDA